MHLLFFLTETIKLNEPLNAVTFPSAVYKVRDETGYEDTDFIATHTVGYVRKLPQSDLD